MERMYGGIRFYIAHRSKGTEAEHKILIDIISGVYGFLCEIEDPSILQIVKRVHSEKPLEEERRLFYVALTRSKEHLYIYTRKKARSKFLEEIKPYMKDPESIKYIHFAS